MASSITIPNLASISGTPVDVAVALIALAKQAQADGNGSSGLAGSTNFKARAVATSIGANTNAAGVLTASANGALASQDGVALAVGDCLFIPEGTTNLNTAAQAGPYLVTSLGSAGTPWVLTRPSWWANGAKLVEAQDISVGGEGTVWAGNSWRCFVAATNEVVGTDAPVMYPRHTHGNTGAASAGVTTSISTLFIAPGAECWADPLVPGGTGGGLQRVTTQTAGAPGTSSIVVTCASTDTSTFTVKVINW